MLPPACIFINSDINAEVINTLTTQLFINENMTFSEFNARVAAVPSYPQIIHLQFMRILVILPSFQDYTNRNLADIVIFFNQGQATIEKNNFGPPGLSLPIDRINIYELLRYNNSPNVATIPAYAINGNCNQPCACFPCFKCCPHGNFKDYPFGNSTNHHCFNPFTQGLGGIVLDQMTDSSGVHAPNCDNEYNNQAFLNRK